MKKSKGAGRRDDARFYPVNGRQLPSVTTILQVFNKPALQYWFAKQQREKDALLAASSKTGKQAAKLILANKKAAEDATKAAMDIGTAVHSAIEWVLRKKLGLPVQDKPVLEGAAVKCYESCRVWFKEEGIEPLAVERTIYDEDLGFAGTLDLYAKTKSGKHVVLDWKTGNRIYPEAYLQNVAYRQAGKRMKMPSDFGWIVRLPKEGGDPEVQRVPDEYTFDDFLVALQAWKLWRRMEGKGVGDEKEAA